MLTQVPPRVPAGIGFHVARLICGLTERELATLSGVSQATIRRLEARGRIPRAGVLHRIAMALANAPLPGDVVTLDDLVIHNVDLKTRSARRYEPSRSKEPSNERSTRSREA